MNSDSSTRPLQAALVMIAAMAIVGVIDNFIIRLSGQIGVWQFHFLRAAIALPLIAALSVLGFGAMRPRRFWRVAIRSLLVGLSMLCYYGALGLMSIAEALAGVFTSPIFIVLISVFFMGIRIGPWRILAVGIGFCGTLLVLQPDPVNFRAVTLLPVAGGLFYALGAVATRSLCQGESTLTLLTGNLLALGGFGLAGLLVLWAVPLPVAEGAEGFLTRGWVWPLTGALPWLVGQAVGAVAGVFLITRAYQMGEPSYVGVFEFSIMGFGPLIAWLAYDQGVGPWQILGIALIALAGGIIAVRGN